MPDGYKTAAVAPNCGLSQNHQEQEGNQTPVKDDLTLQRKSFPEKSLAFPKISLVRRGLYIHTIVGMEAGFSGKDLFKHGRNAKGMIIG